jgi:hypothetical protein
MSTRLTVLGFLLGLAACAPTPPVSTAQMPPGSGLGDPANAIQYSSWAFASAARTRGDVVSAANAVAALDYAAGVLNTNLQWMQMSPYISHEMLRAREAVRRVLGVAPNAPSQALVNSMVAVSFAMSHGNLPAALSALNSPIFTLGPERTLALLTNLPFIRTANIATSMAEGALNQRFCPFGCAPVG